MADVADVGSLIYEKEAELAFERQQQIEEAAEWCKKNYPHKFQFLNEIYKLLVAEQQQMARLGFLDAFRAGHAKPSPVLLLLSPSQALRLLEAFKRATTNDVRMWQVKRFHQMEKVESDRRRDATVEKIRDELRRRKAGDA